MNISHICCTVLRRHVPQTLNRGMPSKCFIYKKIYTFIHLQKLEEWRIGVMSPWCSSSGYTDWLEPRRPGLDSRPRTYISVMPRYSIAILHPHRNNLLRCIGIFALLSFKQYYCRKFHFVHWDTALLLLSHWRELHTSLCDRLDKSHFSLSEIGRFLSLSICMSESQLQKFRFCLNPK